MQITLLDKNKEKTFASFLIKDSTPAYVNSLRRTIINQVPTMAIEDVDFKKNNSILYDEIIAHRLGLVVLSTDIKSYNIPSECNCKGKGCMKCTLKMTLKAKGPGYVYASEIKSKDPKIKPVYPKTIIAKLLKDQEIELEATAMLGEGRDHIKWSPALVFYTYNPAITVNNKSKKFDEFKNKYPPQVFDSSGKIDKKLITGNLIDACEGVCDDVVNIEYDDKSFIFNIESWGQLTYKEIVTKSIDILNKELDGFEKQLTKK
ncbi:DNA-directed RNA polymerase subunit D [Candidatus Woesearchaeota archaeon]|nr:DNA-directed RNA polymerase subunit D [Candidatus Woesearchaeota archaeon]